MSAGFISAPAQATITTIIFRNEQVSEGITGKVELRISPMSDYELSSRHHSFLYLESSMKSKSTSIHSGTEDRTFAIVHNPTFSPLATLPLALEQFDKLPDSAHVPIEVTRGLYACSNATVWRRVKTGDIPAPVKFGQRTTRWSVGALRAALALSR